MAITVTLSEADEIEQLSRESFINATAKAAYSLLYGLKVNLNYRELYIYWNVIKEWRQSAFVSDEYNNIITKDDLLKMQSRINEIK